MEIRLRGKFVPPNTSNKEVAVLSYIGKGFVIVDYLDEDIFLGDVFILNDGTEITLKEIKLDFYTKEPLTEMGKGWKCYCKFDNLDLQKSYPVSNWYYDTAVIKATKKQL